ncbi:hypothetical protein EDB81DRAFT_877853 [Dactylonectria macrodidyma]|uniref:Tafazzin n=1 Tax=Dactylonectria macrodidyma TaxID=307937 RepID=A0A9P9JFP6_9HYPO|nr:hypothetical protein EDB81DRAFT_877853 [Dactylonectria macrodidyma]
MPKKRNIKSFKPSSPALPTAASSSSIADKPQKSVNDLLANLRRTSSGPSTAAQSAHPATAPSVPPVIREILQIPETPAPRPRRPVRQRFDGNGRRLPAGPPPPRSWLSRTLTDGSDPSLSSAASRMNLRLADTSLPGTYLPVPGSLIEIVLRKLAYDWSFHRVYNQYHLYFVPNHLKAALIRFVGIASEEGLSLSDLKTILLPPPDTFEEDELEGLALSNPEVNYLDLSGSIGRNLRLKDVGSLLFPTTDEGSVEPQESWDSPESVLSPPRSLLPNLTHLSLAIDPLNSPSASWKQLIALSTKLTSLTHLSLAHWPDPSLMTVTSPHEQIPRDRASLYCYPAGHDWSEALLVLRLLSRNLYALEYLDLTGCTPWFPALMAESDHDHVDWVTNWGKITNLRLCTGLKLKDIPHQMGKEFHKQAGDNAKNIERHIRAARAGKGRFVVVERDE